MLAKMKLPLFSPPGGQQTRPAVFFPLLYNKKGAAVNVDF
jgi:hypothetical protein